MSLRHGWPAHRLGGQIHGYHQCHSSGIWKAFAPVVYQGSIAGSSSTRCKYTPFPILPVPRCSSLYMPLPSFPSPIFIPLTVHSRPVVSSINGPSSPSLPKNTPRSNPPFRRNSSLNPSPSPESGSSSPSLFPPKPPTSPCILPWPPLPTAATSN